MVARADRMEVLAGTDRQDITDKKFLSQPKHNRRGDSERVAAPVVFLGAIWKLRIGVLWALEALQFFLGRFAHGDVPDDSDWTMGRSGGWQHGLEKKAGDVGEESAFALADLPLGDESEELGHDAAEFFAGAKFGGAGKELIGDGLSLGVIGFFHVALVNNAEFIGGVHVGIQAALSVT